MNNKIQLWRVGGAVRDSILGITSKDIDFAVEAESWDAMLAFVNDTAVKVYLVKPEFYTIRALWSAKGFGDALARSQAVDFVLCRKDGAYSDGRRPDAVTAGTIDDDLARRDFTMNAIAQKYPDGDFYDPFNGIADTKAGIIRCVGDPWDRFNEDPLRILRGIRFAITKGFKIETVTLGVMQNTDLADKLVKTVSVERIREELHRCFAADTDVTLQILSDHFPYLRKQIFQNTKLWLMPSLRE